MGRALYSHQVKVASAPAVRTEPEPKMDVCERWSAWNRFDPDSEDFFQDAEYEAFVDPAQIQRQHTDLSALVVGGDVDISDSSDSSDSSSDSEQGSPMAVGPDDPAMIMTGSWSVETEAGGSADVEWRSPTPDSTVPRPYTSNTPLPVFVPRSPRTSEDVGIPVFIPPASLRELTPEIEDGRGRDAAIPRSPTVRRTVNITPITVVRIREPSSRSPSPRRRRRSTAGEAPVIPSTPPSASHMGPTMMSPSPPPSVTPRFYSWQHHPIPAIPSSPILSRGTPDGPLTNPRARMSFARIESSPARIRVSNNFI